MQNHSVRVEFSGQQCSCMVGISWVPEVISFGAKNLHILRLQNNKQESHYVSATSSGLSPKDSKFLRIHGKFGGSLGLTNGELISLQCVNSTQPIVVKTAFVSCICPDDWEILESNAEIVTNNLLNQLRVVYVGLKFPFWVSKSMTINLKIDKIDPIAEFGILDNSSEIIIPSLRATTSMNNSSISGLPHLRLHPIVLFESEQSFFVPSVTLVLNNVRHAFAYELAFDDHLSANEHEQSKSSYLFAKFLEAKNEKETQLSPVIVKVFFLDYLDINEQILQNSFPLTNPPALFVHPELLKRFQTRFTVKSWVYLGAATEEEFIQQQYEQSRIPIENINQSGSTCEDFAGFDKLIREGCNFLRASLSLGDVSHKCIGLGFGNLLITGREGSGKTALSNRLIQQLTGHPLLVHSEIISCPKLKGKKTDSIEKHFNSVLENAAKFQPAIILMDDLDVLIPAVRSEQQNPAEEFHYYSISETLLDCIARYNRQQIICIATARGQDSLNPCLKSRQGFHFFQKCIRIPPPSQLERLKIFQVCMKPYLRDSGIVGGTEEYLKSESGRDIPVKGALEPQLSTFIETSLANIHDEFASPLLIRRVAEKWAFYLDQLDEGNSSESLSLNEADGDVAFQKIIRDEIKDFGGSPDENSGKKLTWDNIGGLSEVKKDLTKILEWPIKYPKLFANSPVKLPSGILLYGYPGSGKTLLALSIPSIVNAKFIHIKGPELLSKFIGASEQSVKDLFQRAKDSKPCVLFFDEFDSLVPRRGHDSTGVTDRVVNQFLAEMDGVDGGMGQGVHLIAATSRPDLIDPAILRPGRLDKHLFFPMPTKEERVEILKRQSEQVNLCVQWGDEDWDLIGRETEGFTGADLHSLLFSTQMASIQQYLGELETNESIPEGSDKTDDLNLVTKGPENSVAQVAITMEHLRTALSTFQPSLQGKEFKKFQMIYEDFSNARSGSGGGAGTSTSSVERRRESGKRATLA